MKAAALLILSLPLAVHGAEVYRCIEPDGRVTFGDTPCPTGEVYRHSVQAPLSGWDPYSIMIQNAQMLSDYEARLARQRDRPVRTYPGFEDRIRSRELRMERDRAHAGMERSSGLRAWAYGEEARELNRQLDHLYRYPTGR